MLFYQTNRLNRCLFPSKYSTVNRFQMRTLVRVKQFDRELVLVAKQTFCSIYQRWR